MLRLRKLERAIQPHGLNHSCCGLQKDYVLGLDINLHELRGGALGPPRWLESFKPPFRHIK